MSDEFIQVLHNGYDHWLKIMKMKSLSLTVCMHASVSTKVKHQIAALLATRSKTIKLSFVDVQKQSGVSPLSTHWHAYILSKTKISSS